MGRYEEHLARARATQQQGQDRPQLHPIAEPIVRLPLPSLKSQGIPHDPSHPWRGDAGWEEWYSWKLESIRLRGD